MIKRRFYKGGDRDDSSDSSSSSSDSDSDSIHEVEEEDEEEDPIEEVKDQGEEEDGDAEVEIERAESAKRKTKKKIKKDKKRSPSPGSGYQSEDSSVNEVNIDSSGLPASDEDDSEGKGGQNLEHGQSGDKPEINGAGKYRQINLGDASPTDFADCILKCKSVFKCKLCPRIVCLSEESVKAHLNSKRHARSQALHDEGRLKLMLNSDGELEEDQETHAERHSRTVALAKEPVAHSKKDSGRKRQSMRRKKRMQKFSRKDKAEQSNKKSAKKRQKIQD